MGKIARVFVLFATVFLLPMVMPVCALAINVDQVIWEPDGYLDPSSLSASVEFDRVDCDSNEFRIILTNTSSYGYISSAPSESASYPSGVLLTGIGFNLPVGYSILGGSLLEAATNVDYSEHWGYDNNPLDSGPFQTGEATTLSVNTVVSTMESSNESDSSFSTFIGEKAKFAGPDYGILSDAYPPTEDYYPENYPHIYREAWITIALSGSGIDWTMFDWVTFFSGIDSRDVVVSFGSPTAPVPEPATMLLLGTGLIGLAGFSRKRFKKAA